MLMKLKPGLILATLAVMVSGPAYAKKPKLIEAEIDLAGRFGTAMLIESDAVIVIDDILINRAQPEGSSVIVEIVPEFAANQIGYYDGRYERSLIVLENLNLEEFVREAATLGFAKAGYLVVTADDTRAADADHVSIEVQSLWTWVEGNPGKSNKKFNFDIQTLVTSDADELASIGTINTRGYRNGSRPASGASYRNTALHVMKTYLNDFSTAVTASVARAASRVPVRSLKEELEELQSLLDAGVLTEAEYDQLREKAISNY